MIRQRREYEIEHVNLLQFDEEDEEIEPDLVPEPAVTAPAATQTFRGKPSLTIMTSEPTTSILPAVRPKTSATSPSRTARSPSPPHTGPSMQNDIYWRPPSPSAGSIDPNLLAATHSLPVAKVVPVLVPSSPWVSAAELKEAREREKESNPLKLSSSNLKSLQENHRKVQKLPSSEAKALKNTENEKRKAKEVSSAGYGQIRMPTVSLLTAAVAVGGKFMFQRMDAPNTRRIIPKKEPPSWRPITADNVKDDLTKVCWFVFVSVLCVCGVLLACFFSLLCV